MNQGGLAPVYGRIFSFIIFILKFPDLYREPFSTQGHQGTSKTLKANSENN